MSHPDRDRYGIDKSSAAPDPADPGDIRETMIDTPGGQATHAVLSFGGFLGLGAKLFVVPLEALQRDTVNQRFILDLGKDWLTDAPAFDPDNWSDISDWA